MFALLVNDLIDISGDGGDGGGVRGDEATMPVTHFETALQHL